ncbi:MAG: hypothetical protein JNK12_08270 [Acidimicrobiales bacterium]|nr:hypothetical protein [Acidimicrobiales bacterium]
MVDPAVEGELTAEPSGLFVWLAFGALVITAVGVLLRIIEMATGDESLAVGLLSLVFQVAFGLWLSRVFWRIAQRRAA